MKERLTVGEAAEQLGVSKVTIRRRIRNKQLKAIKAEGTHGVRWEVYADQISPEKNDGEDEQPARQLQPCEDSAPVRVMESQEIQISGNIDARMLHEVRKAAADVIRTAVREAVASEQSKVEGMLGDLNRRLEKQEAMLSNHFKLVDERLRDRMQPKEKKSFWRKLFGRSKKETIV